MEWNRIISELGSAGILTPVDTVILASFCQSYSRYRQCEDLVREQGMTYQDERGNYKINPAARQSATLLAEMRRIANDFGFSPASRTKVDSPAPASDEENDFDAFLAAGESAP
jgi:P27 family predicted phage terminase small subunit